MYGKWCHTLCHTYHLYICPKEVVIAMVEAFMIWQCIDLDQGVSNFCVWWVIKKIVLEICVMSLPPVIFCSPSARHLGLLQGNNDMNLFSGHFKSILCHEKIRPNKFVSIWFIIGIVIKILHFNLQFLFLWIFDLIYYKNKLLCNW